MTAPMTRWSPPPVLVASAAIHGVAAIAALARSSLWPWALGAVALNHLALMSIGLWPRSQWLGPNWTCLPAGSVCAVAITIDDGPDPQVTAPVLDLLDEHHSRATFFCIGERVLKYPDLAREIVRRGHAIENHSQRHRHNFSMLGPGAMRKEIATAQENIVRVTGSHPKFFRAPAGLRNPFLDPVLQGLDLTLASWTRRGFDTVRGDSGRVYERLAASLAARDILLLHDGHAALSLKGQPVILEVLPRLLETLRARNLSAVTLRSALSA